ILPPLAPGVRDRPCDPRHSGRAALGPAHTRSAHSFEGSLTQLADDRADMPVSLAAVDPMSEGSTKENQAGRSRPGCMDSWVCPALRRLLILQRLFVEAHQ